MSAAVSGRLLLTTLHAADAPAAIDRLVELGVEHRSIAASVTAILAQRLLRRACACRSTLPHETPIARSATERCTTCKGDGFSGRICAFELIIVDDELRTAIAAGGTGHEIRALLPQHAYRSMREEAWDLVSAGRTDETEIERIFGVEVA
jgi:type II secretory ATPase GspE/PulE/Tfp pilus assembly ATPase PilB-like protein